MTARTDTAAREPVQARLATLIASALDASAQKLPHDITERLRTAREQAQGVARQRRLAPRAATAPVVVGRGGGSAMLAAPSPWWLKIATGFPVLVLLAGLIAIDRWTTREQVQAAAEIDAMLLADELPPRAYTDPGFVEFLKSSEP